MEDRRSWKDTEKRIKFDERTLLPFQTDLKLTATVDHVCQACAFLLVNAGGVCLYLSGRKIICCNFYEGLFPSGSSNSSTDAPLIGLSVKRRARARGRNRKKEFSHGLLEEDRQSWRGCESRLSIRDWRRRGTIWKIGWKWVECE